MVSAPKRPDLGRQLDETERRLRQLERQTRLRSASIGEGGLRIYGGGDLILEEDSNFQTQWDGGSIQANLGTLFFSEEGQPGMGLQMYNKGDGNPPIWIYNDPSAENKYFAFWGHPFSPIFYFGVDTPNSHLSASDSGNLSRNHSGFTNLVDNYFEINLPSGGFFNVLSESISLNWDNVDHGILVQGTNTWIEGHATAAAGANPTCQISDNGQIFRTSSSIRYKQDVAPAEVDVEKVLELEPKSFRRKDEVAGEAIVDPDTSFQSGVTEKKPRPQADPRTYVGFIAEEADALGLSDWVHYDRDGQPDGFAYDSFVVAQQAVIRRQQTQITDLENRLSALEAATLGPEEKP